MWTIAASTSAQRSHCAHLGHFMVVFEPYGESSIADDVEQVFSELRFEDRARFRVLLDDG
jgi:hypothetical protein